jgi:stage II sporulation protein D
MEEEILTTSVEYHRILLCALLSCMLPASVMAKIRITTKSSSGATPKIRVLIGKGLPKLTVAGKGISRKIHKGIKDQKSYLGDRSIQFRCGSGLRLRSKGGLKQSKLLASISTTRGIIDWNEHGPYRGDFHLARSKDLDGCDLINEVDLESYLESLLSKEMNAVWPLEVLKAQAVAARSYAYYKIRNQEVVKRINPKSVNHYHLESSERDQVTGDLSAVTPKTRLAAGQTRGEILISSKNSELTPIFFHAKCGGRTMTPELVWGNHVGSYAQVKCPHCHSHGKKNWDSDITLGHFRRFLSWAARKEMQGEQGTFKGKITLLPDSSTADRLRIYLDQQLYMLEKPLLRRYFGRQRISSNHFKLVIKNNLIKISGRGLGHGVGMCQLGALDLAQKGWGYRQILSYYYPQHQLQQIY